MAGGVDPTVALRVAPLGQNQLDPFQAMERVVNIGRGMNEIRNQNARFQAQQLGGEIMSMYPGDPVGGAKAMMSNPITAGFAPDIANEHARTAFTLTQNAGAEQDQTNSALHGILQGVTGVRHAMETGGQDAAEEVWNDMMERARAATNPALRTRLEQGAAAIHTQLFQGTQGLDQATAARVVNGNAVNLLVSSGLGGDQIQTAIGQVVERRLGNVVETWRIPPDGSPAQLISSRPVGLQPQVVETMSGQPVVVGGPVGQMGVPAYSPLYFGTTPNQPTVLGPRGIYGSPEEALGGAGQGGIPFTPQPMAGTGGPGAPSGPPPSGPPPSGPPPTGGPTPTPGGPTPGPLLPSTTPGAPQQPAPVTTTAPQTSPDAARPYRVGGGGTFTTTQQLPPEAKQMNYALPNNRMPTTVPDGRAVGAPVFGDGTLGWDSRQDLQMGPGKRAWNNEQYATEGELQKNYAASNAPGGDVATAQNVVAITTRMKHDLQTIAEDPKATAVFLSLGPKLGDRMDAAQWDQMLRNALNQAPDISKESRVALEGFIKDSNSLVIQSARQNLGQSHVAAESINRVAQTSPSIENSPFGALILSDLIKAQAQRTLDQNQFRGAVMDANYGNLRGADSTFNGMHSADTYSNEVLRQYGLLPTGQFIQSKAGLDNFRRQVNSGFVQKDAAPGILDSQFPGWREMHQ